MSDMMLAVDESAKQTPNMVLAQKLYEYELQTKQGLDSSVLQAEILGAVEGDDMAPFYKELCEKYGWPLDEAKLLAMTTKNEKEALDTEAKIADAKINAGDSEVLELMSTKALYLTKIGSWNEAYAAFDAIISKPKVGAGKKIDATMAKARIALFSLDIPKLKELISEAKRLNEAGGDWDRRNRLKVYEAMYLMAIRDVRQASTLLHSCIATFTCVEICSYSQFMLYALLTAIMTLPRNELKKKVVSNPQVISVIRELPNMQTLLHSIYDCEYALFFESLMLIHPRMVTDRFLGPHTTYIVREYRILAYAQFLEAYRSVMMSSMAQSFGLSLPLLDSELSRFIAAGRINAKIDKVGDVVSTSRPDKKNAQYQEVIKKGDALLNQIQKLVRVIEV